MVRAAGFGGRNATTYGGRLPATIGGVRSNSRSSLNEVTNEELLRKIQSIERMNDVSNENSLKSKFIDAFAIISGLYTIIDILCKFSDAIGLSSLLVDLLQNLIRK